jgi:hypothetical protein
MQNITGRGGRLVPPPREKQPFEVLKEAHIPDERGRSQFYAPAREGEEPVIVHLHAEDAKYWLMDGVIRLQETVVEAPSERTQSAKRRRA